MIKLLKILIVAFSFSSAFGMDFKPSALEVGLKSVHFKDSIGKIDPSYKLNETNTGLFLHFNGPFVGAYKNSYYKNSFVVGYEQSLYSSGEFDVGVNAFGVTGYDNKIPIKGGWYQESRYKVQPAGSIYVRYSMFKVTILPSVMYFGMHLKF